MSSTTEPAIPGGYQYNAPSNVDPAPNTVGRQSTSVGDESSSGDVAAYQRARAAADGEKPRGGGGFGIGAADPLVVRSGGADDQTDTGQSGGRPVA